MAPKSSSLTAVSLFSGAGGCCMGIKAARFRVLVAVESDADAVRTLGANASETPVFEGDIRYFLGRHAASQRRKYGLDDVDLVFGGPPCQGHSSAGQRNPEDARNALWRQFARVVAELQPRALIFENVPGLLQTAAGRLAEEILDNFRALGYENAHILQLDAADFGVPQIRKRIFVTATRNDVPLASPLADIMRDSLHRAHRPRVSVSEAIGDLPGQVWPSGHGMVPYPASAASAYARAARRGSPGLTHHHTKDVRDSRRREIIAALAPGADGSSLPSELFTGSRGMKWRRLHPHRCSPTVLANAGRDLSSWIHPVFNRFITVREAARLQGFPDSFVFPVSESAALAQIGNAVPPALAQVVASAIAKALGGGAEVRRRGRPPSGERALTGVERRRAWRERHAVESLELPGAVVSEIRAIAARTGRTMAEVVAAAITRG
jgi:DNA (cytosine-5)-methyltransferase 1